jgi:prepilin-type N-terminal cleavage/methylation domain-containing protein
MSIFLPAKNKGFSFIEVMVAVGLVSIVVAFTSTAIGFAFSLMAVSQENLRASQILQEKMETIRLYNWDQINTPGFVPREFKAGAHPADNDPEAMMYAGTISITNAPLNESYAPEILQVTVDIEWDSAGVTRRREMSTFVARHGLQNYIW